MYTDINKISVNSPIKITPVNIFNLCFIDGLSISRSNYSIADNKIDLLNQPTNDISLYTGYDNGTVYEFHKTLIGNNTVISGNDIFNNILSGLSTNTIMVLVNGLLLAQDKFVILNDTSLRILLDNPVTQINTIQIFVSSNLEYGGVVSTSILFNHDNSVAPYKIPYNQNNILIFINGKKLAFNKISKTSVIYERNVYTFSEFLSSIKLTDKVEYYIIKGDCNSYNFIGELGYLTYGPKDYYKNNIPIFYDTVVTFNGLTTLLIDNLRYGFFIKEVEAEGVLLIIDNHFETQNLKCVTVTPFQKTSYESSEYFLQVPDMRSIVNYIAPYDRQYTLLPEVLEVFQKLILNEMYDEVQRISNLRSLTMIDSINIDKLLKFLGMNIDIQNFTLKNKKFLLEELDNFYRIVGTKDSYNYFNIINGSSYIKSIEQLFTYHNSTNPAQREYVDFFTKEESGAIRRRIYQYPTIDYGSVIEIAENFIDYGTYLPAYNEPLTEDIISIDYGYVDEVIKGKWIEWWEWDRPKNLYPTNHINIELNVNINNDNNESYEETIRKFKIRFYALASAVLYIHEINMSYNFGDYDKNIPFNGNTNVQCGIMSAPVISSIRHSVACDPSRQLNSSFGLTDLAVVNALDPNHTMSEGEFKPESEPHIIKCISSNSSKKVYHVIYNHIKLAPGIVEISLT